MSLSKYLQEECIQTGFHASDKPSVLKAIARLAKHNLLLHTVSEEEILQGLMEREKVVSTGIGNGIAIPHCMLDTALGFVVGILVVPEGVDFDALDRRKTKVFVFILAPLEKKNEHIRVLSSVSNVLRSPDNVREILAGRSATEIRENFLRHIPVETETSAKKDYKQITVIVQHEEVFNQILTVFTEIPESFISVIEAGNVGHYLYSSPLFANFWKEEQKGFTRIILAAVNAALADETIRRISMIIEGTAERSGVLLFLQDISYLSGSLNL